MVQLTLNQNWVISESVLKESYKAQFCQMRTQRAMFMKLCIELALMYSPILLKNRFFAPTFSKVTETQVSFTDFVISVVSKSEARETLTKWRHRTVKSWNLAET